MNEELQRQIRQLVQEEIALSPASQPTPAQNNVVPTPPPTPLAPIKQKFSKSTKQKFSKS